jgi:hypothetical protein
MRDLSAAPGGQRHRRGLPSPLGALRDALNAPQEPVQSPRTPAEVVHAPRNSCGVWQTASPQLRAQLLHQVYEKITVTGKTTESVALTPDARELGLVVALPEQVGRACPRGLEPPTFRSATPISASRVRERAKPVAQWGYLKVYRGRGTERHFQPWRLRPVPPALWLECANRDQCYRSAPA